MHDDEACTVVGVGDARRMLFPEYNVDVAVILFVHTASDESRLDSFKVR